MIAPDFLVASGGDGYSMLPGQVTILKRLVDTPRMVVTDYIRSKGTLDIPSYNDLQHCNDGKGNSVGIDCRISRTPSTDTWYGRCPLGHFRDMYAELPVCTACLAGSYIDSEAASAEVFKCRLCTPGMYADALGSTHCSVCSVMHYARRNGSKECENCPGEWAPSVASADSVIEPYIA
jgi:hypothetical protein